MDVAAEIHYFDKKDFGSHDDLFDKLEQHKGINIMACSADEHEWSNICMLYADLVIVAADFNANTELYPIEKELDLYSQDILNKKTYLLLLHPKDGPMAKTPRLG